MKARITSEGVLVMQLESSLEVYALNCWLKENIKPISDRNYPVMMDFEFIGEDAGSND